MKLGIAAHCTIDSIVLNDLQYDVAGGPACYAAFTAKTVSYTHLTLPTNREV